MFNVQEFSCFCSWCLVLLNERDTTKKIDKTNVPEIIVFIVKNYSEVKF